MAKLMLTDELWSKLRTIIHQQDIYDKPDLRVMVDGTLYRMRAGYLQHDVPSVFGYLNSIYPKFNH